MKNHFLLLAFVGFAVSSCQTATQVQSGDAYMRGKVLLFDQNCDTLSDHSGATITAPSLGRSTTSSSTGEWQIEGIPEGLYEVNYSKVGFYSNQFPKVSASKWNPIRGEAYLPMFPTFDVSLEDVHFKDRVTYVARDTIVGYPDTIFTNETYLTYTVGLSELNPGGMQRYALLLIGKGKPDPMNASTFILAHMVWRAPTEKRFVVEWDPWDNLEEIKKAGAKSGEILTLGLFPIPDCGGWSVHSGSSFIYPAAVKSKGVFATVKVP